jgi:ADP-ribosyl-[dinitrogen reductase] hydrolase
MPDERDRVRGALVGLAVGDAVGTAVEFTAPGSFPPVTDMTGGGPFELAPGQWTDDTSMALCLAESLIERGGMDPRDQMERYVRWWREGHLSSTGRCFDIGDTVRAALARFEQTGDPLAGPTDPYSAGNGSLMRLAPVAMRFRRDPARAIEACGESSRTTHGARAAVDACRYFGALLVGAMAGAPKDALVAPHYAPLPNYWDRHPLADPEIAAVAGGSFRGRRPPAIRGSGHVVRSLEAALWAFHESATFRDGCLLAVNLGEDADTTAAVYGQLAGAHYGEDGIPAEWRGRLARWEVVDEYAEALYREGVG